MMTYSRFIPKQVRAVLLLAALLVDASCQTTTTGSQSLTFAGLRATAGKGQFTAVKADASGNLYLLFDQGDGVRLLKSDPSAATIVAETFLGARGDIGLSLALDPSGNVYVAGTTTSSIMTATSGAAFPARSGAGTNSFIAKFDPGLNPLFVTFAGADRIAATSVAATADAVFLTGSLFGATLPVTANGILQTPAFGSQQNGFVERFSADGTTLVYATYLTGAQGDTSPTAIVADAGDNAYVTGSTTASGYPTVAALVPRIQPQPSGISPASGFLTKLAPQGDSITVSTFIPGTGISSMALDSASQNLLLAGTVALGQFPVTIAQFPLVATPYQVLLRLPLDASSVLASTVIAPGSQSFVSAAPNGAAWVDGMLSAPLLPLTPLSDIGTAFAARVSAAHRVDQTTRFGGLPTTNPNHATAPVILDALTTDPSGAPIVAGAFQPNSDASLIATEQYDLSLTQPTTPVLPSAVPDAPVATCSGSLCPGLAAYLAKLAPDSNTPSLVLSTVGAPDITLRNLGSAPANDLRLAAAGFSLATNCGNTLAAGAECSIALTGGGPGKLTAQASNATTQVANLPATTTNPTPIVFSPRELDFGVQTASSAPITRVLTVTNVSQQTQTFGSALDFPSRSATAPFSQLASDCAVASTTTSYTLPPGAACHITFAFALNASVPDGPVEYPWTVAVTGTHDVLLKGYAQSANLSVSASEIDFGTQFVGGIRTSRSVFLSNQSDSAILHTAVTLPPSSPFAVADACPLVMPAHSICQLVLNYNSRTSPTDDATTLALDNGLSVLVTGQTLPQPGVGGTTANPNLSVTPATIAFATPVAVTAHSSSTQSIIIANTGTSSFSLNLNLMGDFIDTTNCPASLAANTSCSVVVRFAPSQPGTRDGVLSVTAGAGSTPVYVALTGTATAILPDNNGILNSGSTPLRSPSVRWYKVAQAFPGFAATATGAWSVFLSEDVGYGHANPAATAFQTNASGSCLNCWLGVQFLPTEAGAQTGSLILSSASVATPYVVSLTGTGLPVTGLLASPVNQDFGSVPLHSTSRSFLFSLTNLVAPPGTVVLTAPTVTGDFAISTDATGGPACVGPLAALANCYIRIAFSPTGLGARTGSLTFGSSTGPVTVALSGFGAPDPGMAFSPNSLLFENVPGLASTQQVITVTNTGTSPASIGTPSTPSSSFAATTACATLAPGASCSVTVTYLPASAPVTAMLSLPVTTNTGGAPVLSTMTVPLEVAYTSQTAGLQILPSVTDYGPATVDILGIARTFTVTNLTPKSASVTLSLPRQFALTTPNQCPTLAANASCDLSVTYLPATSGITTGTLAVQAVPTDGSPLLTGLAYLEGYGTPIPAATLGVSGPLTPGSGILDFGQVTSGQTVTRMLTLTNTSSVAGQQIAIRRVTSPPPFLSTTTCASLLALGENCTITLSYTATNQVSAGSPPTPATVETGTLTMESDAASAPNVITLTGAASPVAFDNPSNVHDISAFTLSEGSLTFPQTATGDASPPQTITLENTGTVAFRVLGLQTTPDFHVTSTCDQALTNACTLSVVFAPQLQNQTNPVHNATLEIQTDSGIPLEFVSLLGVATAPTLGILPSSLDFGAVVVGQIVSLPVQVTNTGAVPVQFQGITVTGDYRVGGSCPAAGGSLSAGTSCTMQISCAPTGTGTRTGILSIASDSSALPLVVTLTGVGTQSQLQISPSTLDFGPIAVGASANRNMRFTNSGTAPVSGLSLSVTGDYAVTVPCPSATLAPAQSCDAVVTFTPSTVGARVGTLLVVSSDPTSPVSVPLTGSGVQNGGFILTVNGGSTASTSVRQGYPANDILAVTPTGGFSGNVVLNCTPIATVAFASCSILPSSITLAPLTAQNSALTINTVTAIQRSSIPPALSRIVVCLLVPFGLVLRRRGRRKVWPLLALLLCAILPVGCGGGPNPDFRYTPPGTYQYQVTATSTSGTQISRMVVVTLVVTN